MNDTRSSATSGRLGLVLVAVVTALVVGPLGAFVASRALAPPESVQPAAKYQCPMHPAVVMDHEGTCPICGMKLVKMGTGELSEHEDEALSSDVDGLAVIDIDPAQQQLIGLRTAKVDRGVVGGDTRTVGRVSVDETRVRHIPVRVPGYVERIFVDFVGKPVRRGQPLFSLYSPDVLAAENELLVALATGDSSGPLVTGARRKLELWNVPEAEIARVERERKVSRLVTFVSPVDGVVTKKEIVEGARLEAGAMPYEVVDLSVVWVLAEVYESELRFVSPGVPATLRVNAYPDQTWTGKVLFVDPVLDPKTRTARARLVFPNPSGELKPELFGEVTLHRPPREALRVPVDALVRTGTESVVFVARGGGKFEPRRVRIGEVGRDFVEVQGGLTEGEAVVTRANFLVDSESRLRASLARMSEQPSATPADSAAEHAGHGSHP